MKTSKQNGFAMVETLMTAVILAIGISGIGVLLLQALQATQDTSQQSQAMWMVQDLVGRMRANPEGARSGAYEFNGPLNCNAAPQAQCADTNLANAVMCDSTEMAIYDQWITVCGEDPDNFDSSADFVIQPELTITCTLRAEAGRSSTNSGQIDCVQYFVEIEWNTKLQQTGDDVAERDFRNIYSMVVELN